MLKYARFTENPRVQFLEKFRPVRLGSLHSHQRYTAWADRAAGGPVYQKISKIHRKKYIVVHVYVK